MELDLYELLSKNPLLNLFLILGFGLLIGRLRLAGVQLGSVTGVLLVGLVMGHWALSIPTASHDIGFILFIYCVGVEAGPRMFSIFRAGGASYPVLCLITAVMGTLTAWATASFFDFELGIAAGMLAGGLTSTPTLVAAQDALAQGLALPQGMSEADVLGNMSAAYAITYVFGLGGLVVVTSLIPRLFGIDLNEEARHLSESREFEPVAVARNRPPAETPSIRSYCVDKPEAIGFLYQDHDHSIPGAFQKIKRGEEVFTPDAETRIEEGDIVAGVGLQHVHDLVCEQLGSEVLDTDVLDRSVESRKVVVSRREVVGRSLQEMDWGTRSQVWLTQFERAGLSLPRRPEIRLQLGDELLLTGARSRLDEIAEEIGHAEHELEETDLVTFAFGIALGLFVGTFSVTLGGTSVGVGMAGGVLLAGLGFGLLHSRRPYLGRLPGGARFILMELGLLLFMAQIAVNAGTDVVETFAKLGPTLALCGVVVTVVPVFTCFVVGRVVFKLNAALLLGAVSGSMTSTAALKQVSSQAGSSVPMLGYVGTYAFANVLLAFAGSLIMRL